MAERTTATRQKTDLEAALRQRLEGEVRFTAGTRAMYAQDASHYRQLPIGVVFPRHVEDVVAAVDVCRVHKAAVLARGGGTSLAGQGCNAAVVIDMSKYLNRILEIDPDRRMARVEPGVILDDLRDAAEQHGLTFGPDPSTHASCTMAGMIGNNACGVHSLMAGKTVDNVEAMEVLTWDAHRFTVGATSDDELSRIEQGGDRRAEIYRRLRTLRDKVADDVRREFPDIPRRVSGYNLDELLPERGFNVARALVGTEGTCALALEATVRLVTSPPRRTLVVVGYADIAAAGDDVPRLLEFGPIGLEGMGVSLVDNMRAKGLEPKGVDLLPEGDAWLFVEFGGESDDEANDRAAKLVDALKQRAAPPPLRTIPDRAVAAHVWKCREAGVGASSRLADGRNTEGGWEDAAVHPDRLGDYLRAFNELLDRHGYRSTQYGHFGQGLVHTRIDFDLASRVGIAAYRAFVEEAADLVVSYGGTLSGEHGDGRSRAELWPRMFSDTLMRAFGEFKAIWDPQNRMNPGRLIDPAALDTDLRLGSDYQLPQIDTHFTYPNDEGNFARAAARCIGVGKCRREHGGTMCPSYKVVREEQHSTRGRARLLAAMAEGELPDGWSNEEVKDALDLCLACKGCKHDCPAGVDVAMYKAEFLAHHFEGKRRPLQAHLFGRIHQWLRLGSIAPGVANFFSQTPGFDRLAKAMAGVASQRQMPRLARQPFKRWFLRRERSKGRIHDGKRPCVVIWPDTFNNYFASNVGRAVVRVFEAAGYHVVVPTESLCCGRPLYDFGMLDRARRQLKQILDTFEREGIGDLPMVGMEPSCIAVFRDELLNFFPDDPRARQLASQTMTLAEFLARDPAYQPPARTGRALYHGHCHQQAVMGSTLDVALLRDMGLEVATPDTGCCGMAGSFGFKARHYDVSVAVGEQVLLPAVRDWPEDQLIVTDGFSCREQIHQLTGRRTMHLAEVLAASLPDAQG